MGVSSPLALRVCVPLCAAVILRLLWVDGVSQLLCVAVTSTHAYVRTQELSKALCYV